MKKLLFIFLLIPCISFAKNSVVREIPRYNYIDVVKKTVIETQYIKVKIMDMKDLDSGTINKSDDTYTYTITIKKVKKIK